MLMIMSQIRKFVDFTKTQKCRYIKKKIFFLQIEKFINYTLRATLLQKNSFVAEVTFKILRRTCLTISLIWALILSKNISISAEKMLILNINNFTQPHSPSHRHTHRRDPKSPSVVQLNGLCVSFQFCEFIRKVLKDFSVTIYQVFCPYYM